MNSLVRVIAATFCFCFLAPPLFANDQQQGRNSSAGDNQSAGADGGTRAKIHTELASMYFQAGNMAVALEELRIATGADRRYAPAYSIAGLVFASLRENEKAEEQFRKALAIAPDDPEINNNYGWFLCQSGKERQSIVYFLNALKNALYPTPDLAYANAGRCALMAGDLAGAESYLYQALRFTRNDNEALNVQWATLRYRQGRLDEARRLVNASLKTMGQPTAEALWLALRIERKQGNRGAESALAAQLRGRFPDSIENQAFLKGNFE